ncbi:hypothetical protein LR48_Vigan07g232500 [Vigna angularis]|uniref:Uncharacterized protein n=1 Tax=Phaseolus angularis TaxID=3914 RepID=A0A0L9V101_PHAAN|nr:hypothetical protein LR48_Vigan07g232500 [Vigna angularis]
MQSLQEKASEWSGVAIDDAFSIDNTNLFNKLGLQTFINLSTNFYNRVYAEEEEWFRSIFANSKKEDAIQNQYEFFVQRMGGPPLFSQRRALSLLFAPVRCRSPLSTAVSPPSATVNCSLELSNLVVRHTTSVRCCPPPFAAVRRRSPPFAAVRRHSSVRRPPDLVRLFTRRPTPPVGSPDSPPRSATRRLFVRCDQARAVHAPPSAHRKVAAPPP